MLKPPLFLGGLALGLGYGWAALRRVPRPVSRELMQFHRRDQLKKLRTIIGSLLRFKEVDSFHLQSDKTGPETPK